jgi:hypothetical protein
VSLRATLTVAIPAVAILAVAADLDTGFDPAFGLPDVVVAQPSFSGDIQPIFDRRCLVGGCHTLASAQAGLILHASVSYDSLVNAVGATLEPSLRRVVPFEPDESWLVRMIGDDPVARDGRSRMPLAAAPLTPNQIQTIVNWIARGAPRD